MLIIKSNMDRAIAFREKTACLVRASMGAAYTLYFGMILADHPAGREVVPRLWLFGRITLVQLVVVIAGSIFIAVRTPKEARDRADERDRAIARRGGAAGYYVLMVGMILVGIVMPFVDTGEIGRAHV